MPASINSIVVASGNADGTTLTTPAITCGGVNRALFVVNHAIGPDSPANYSSSVTNVAASTLINDIVGSDISIDVFAFTYSWAKSFGETNPPTTPFTLLNTWPETSSSRTAVAFALEDVDQTTPLGAEGLSSLQFLSGTPFANTYFRPGLEPNQKVIGALVLFAFGDEAGLSFADNVDSDAEILGEVTSFQPDSGRRSVIVYFEGQANSGGDFYVAIDTTWADTGQLIQAIYITRPLNEATGGPSEITVTADIAEEADALAASAAAAVSASSAVTEGADALAGVSGAAVAVAGAVTEGADALAGVAGGAVAVTGAVTEGADALVSSATVAVSASSTVTEAADTLTATGAVASTAVGSLTEASDTLASSATVAEIVTAAIAEGADTLAGTSTIADPGVTVTANITEESATLAASSAISIAAVSALLEEADAIVGLAFAVTSVTATLIEGSDTLSGSAAVAISVTVTVTEGDDSLVGRTFTIVAVVDSSMIYVVPSVDRTYTIAAEDRTYEVGT